MQDFSCLFLTFLKVLNSDIQDKKKVFNLVISSITDLVDLSLLQADSTDDVTRHQEFVTQRLLLFVANLKIVNKLKFYNIMELMEVNFHSTHKYTFLLLLWSIC